MAVLGASGYLGGAVLARARAAGMTVRAYSRNPCDATVGELRLDEEGALARAVAGCATIVHLVAGERGGARWREQGAEETLELRLLRHLLDLVGPGQRIVYASSAALSRPADVRTPYEKHKLAAERLLAAAPAVTLRIPTVYGVSWAGAVGRGAVSTLLSQALDTDTVRVWGRGDNRRHLLHVQDVADAVLAAGGPSVPTGRRFDLAAGSELTLHELAVQVVRAAAEITGRTAAILSVRPPGHAAEHDLADAMADPGPFLACSGWFPVRRDMRKNLVECARQLAATPPRRRPR